MKYAAAVIELVGAWIGLWSGHQHPSIVSLTRYTLFVTIRGSDSGSLWVQGRRPDYCGFASTPQTIRKKIPQVGSCLWDQYIETRLESCSLKPLKHLV